MSSPRDTDPDPAASFCADEQDAARFSAVDAGCRSRSPTASADAACSSPRCYGARTVVSGLGGDEMVAVGSAESEQAAVDKTENFHLP